MNDIQLNQNVISDCTFELVQLLKERKLQKLKSSISSDFNQKEGFNKKSKIVSELFDYIDSILLNFLETYEYQELHYAYTLKIIQCLLLTEFGIEIHTDTVALLYLLKNYI